MNRLLACTCVIAMGSPLFTGCSESSLVAGVDTPDSAGVGTSESNGTTPTTPPPSCAGLPAGAQLIPGLVSGQALTSGGTVTLQFSNEAFACGSWLTGTTSQGCQDPWAFSLTVPASAIQPGTYDLAAISAQFGELYGVASPPESGSSASCTYGSYGIGSVGVAPQGSPDSLVSGGTLEIFSDGPQCLTGKIAGLTDVMTDAPDHNGVFFALPCGQ